MKLRRGFKAEANAYSREFRKELGLPAEAPLCPFKLAKHLGVRAIPLGQFANDEPQAIDYLKSKHGKKEFSAITLCFGMERLIIYNDAHTSPRTTSNVAHELSHIILMHPAKPPFDENGSRHYDAVLEDEANWLGPALLISEEAALKIGRDNQPHAVAAKKYGVSGAVLRMRLNVLGVARRLAYSKR